MLVLNVVLELAAPEIVVLTRAVATHAWSLATVATSILIAAMENVTVEMSALTTLFAKQAEIVAQATLIVARKAVTTVQRSVDEWKTSMKRDLLNIIRFKSSVECRKWMIKNHRRSEGIWIRIFKKSSAVESITYAEALDQALCFGWIDGQKQKYDDQSWLQRFTPRRSKSNWSKINTEHAERLIKSRKMAPAGLKVIRDAKADGRWRSAYDSPSKAVIPKDFLEALGRNKKALRFFNSLNKSNQYGISYRLQTAKKPETRARRIKLILDMMRKGQKFHG